MAQKDRLQNQWNKKWEEFERIEKNTSDDKGEWISFQTYT